MNLNKKRLK